VPLARASWLITVAVCLIAAILFAINGYSGYTITLIAVGGAAAVNLLPPA
jgi:membrane protein YdbS with pleckstrin-like domain